MSVELDVVTALNDAAIGLTAGVNLFAGPRRGANKRIPNKAVFVLQTGGQQPRAIKGGVEEKKTMVQITVRSDLSAVSSAYSDGLTLAESVFSSLQYQPAVGYCDWTFVSSSPLYLGQDSNGAHLWSMNLEALYFRQAGTWG